ncbi:hypothetical protein V2J09_021620 [Rumex salicifolius]
MEALSCAGPSSFANPRILNPKKKFNNGSSFFSTYHPFRVSDLSSILSTYLSLNSIKLPCKASSFDLSPPPIEHDFLESVLAAGATVSDDEVIETFGSDEEALEASENGVAIVDLSHWGRIRVSGDDRIHFLHNQSTANFESLREGQGSDTVFVTPTARTIDIAHTWIMKNAVLLVVSPETVKSISEMLGKYIFFADKVEIKDITSDTSLFAILGPKSDQVMESLGLSDLIGEPYGTHRHYRVNEMPVTVGVGTAISEQGYTMMLSPAAAGSVWKSIVDLDAVPMGSNAWERLRIFQGRPAPGKELTAEYNVLEAGLWNTISMNKGCYKGQETVARLITYDGVKQNLWGLTLSAPVEPGSPITVDGKKVGKLTSYALGRNESEHVGLGYVKRRAASLGDKVTVGDNIVATLVDVPYLAGQSIPS